MNSHVTYFSLLVLFIGISLSAIRVESLKPSTVYKPIAINIDTSTLQTCPSSSSPSKPLHLTALHTGLTYLINTGASVQTVSANQVVEVANSTGGVLGKNAFRLETFQHYWTNSNTSEFTGTTINNNGVPYEARLLYRNKKYNSIAEAMTHSDGIFELVFLFSICSGPNQRFTNLSRLFQKIPRAVSFTPAYFGIQMTAVDFIPENSEYFTYSGSGRNMATDQIHECSTVIVIKPNTQYCITKNQFIDTFGPLRNPQGNQFISTLTRGPSKQVSMCRDVTQSLYH